MKKNRMVGSAALFLAVLFLVTVMQSCAHERAKDKQAHLNDVYQKLIAQYSFSVLGGAYFDEQDDLHVLTIDESIVGEIEQYKNVHAALCTYSYQQLQAYMELAKALMSEDFRINTISLDEINNRIVISVQQLPAEDIAGFKAEKLNGTGIPPEAVELIQEEYSLWK